MSIELRLTNYSGLTGADFWVVEVAAHGYRSPDMALTGTWTYSTWIAGGLPVWVAIYQAGVAIPKYAINLIIPQDWRKYRLEVNTSTLVDEGEVPGAPTPQGQITLVELWNAVSGNFQSTAPTVPFGALIGAKATMKNNGTVNQAMYLKFTLKRPDGSVRSTFTGPSLVVAPSATDWSGWTDWSDMQGTWTMVIELDGSIS